MFCFNAVRTTVDTRVTARAMVLHSSLMKRRSRRAWALVVSLTSLNAACLARSEVRRPPAEGDAGTESMGARSGSDSGGGAAGEAAGIGGSGGRVIVIGGAPPDCTTDSGEPGLLVDTFPLPPAKPRCEALNQPGKLDSNCPAEPFLTCGPAECLGRAPLAGCCRPDGTCGLWDAERWAKGKGLGCISREPWVENGDAIGEARVPVSCIP